MPHLAIRRPRATTLLAALFAAACSPHLPPTNVPATSPELEPFRITLQKYVDLTQADRKLAAEAGARVPAQDGAAPGAETAVRARSNMLADALGSTLRPSAKQGDLIVPPADAIIRQSVQTAFDGPQRELLMDELAEQNDESKASSPAPPIIIHAKVEAPRVPPLLLDALPALPKQLEYDFIGRILLVRDVDADVVVDYLPDTLPEPPPAGAEEATSAPPEVVDGPPLLPLPGIRGSTTFAAIGDSGTGDTAQATVAKSMVAYFEHGRRFPFVLMLGDNLYGDDYTNEFLMPYKTLLDSGVKFYAVLGNHDRDLQIHFKPFNMQDRDYYSFDRGNARFIALNSNKPSDPAQAKWLSTAVADAGTKWRIAFFHHPLFSSGEHAMQSREVIRPALEPVLVQNQVDLVFSGHEHAYQRVAPQKGIRYFVSGGGGRSLYDLRPNQFDEVAVSEHHFMVVEIDGDRLFFEAITPDQKILDCGILYRRPDAAKNPDKTAQEWQADCDRTAQVHPQKGIAQR